MTTTPRIFIDVPVTYREMIEVLTKLGYHPEFDGKLIIFSADSDGIITRGIVALLIKVLSRRTPEEIISTDLYFIEKIGLRQNLSPTRSNGLLSMVRQMKLYAMAFNAIK